MELSQSGDMAAAVEAAFSASTPDVTTTTTDTTPASAITTPVQGSQAAAPTQTTPEPEPGPVPYPRFKEVNEKATKAEERLKQFEWLKPEHSQELQRFYQRVTGGDPLTAYLDELAQLVQARPDLAGPMKSWAARTLGTRAAAQVVQEPAEETEPQPDIPLDDGRFVYSAQQQAKLMAYHRKQWDASINEKLQPLQETANEQKAAAVYATIQADANVYANKTVAEMRTKPHFKELEGDIKTRMASDKTLSLREAYAQSFIEKVIPQNAATKAAALQQKVGASSANPARPSGAAPAPARDFREAIERELAAQSR